MGPSEGPFSRGTRGANVGSMRYVSLALVFLAACDPVIGLDVTVVVPPEAQAAYTGTFPAQVAIAYLGPSSGDEVVPTSFGILCEAKDTASTFTSSSSYVGCADETEVRAWLVPVHADVVVDCTVDPPTSDGSPVDPVAEAPWASATAFRGMHDECASVDEAVTLTLMKP